MKNEITTPDLFTRVAELIEQSRKYVAKAVNTAMVATYYEIGRYIIEDEQQGKARAEYGKRVLPELSQRLTEQFGSGWSVENLTAMKKFYSVYSSQIGAPLETKSKIVTTGHEIADSKIVTTGQQIQETNSVNTVSQIPTFVLPWTHYQILMRVSNPDELVE